MKLKGEIKIFLICHQPFPQKYLQLRVSMIQTLIEDILVPKVTTENMKLFWSSSRAKRLNWLIIDTKLYLEMYIIWLYHYFSLSYKNRMLRQEGGL